MTAPDLDEAVPPPEEGSVERYADRRVSIEPNGREFLVMVNGAPFLALSREQAEAIARRARRRSRGY